METEDNKRNLLQFRSPIGWETFKWANKRIYDLINKDDQNITLDFSLATVKRIYELVKRRMYEPLNRREVLKYYS